MQNVKGLFCGPAGDCCSAAGYRESATIPRGTPRVERGALRSIGPLVKQQTQKCGGFELDTTPHSPQILSPGRLVLQFSPIFRAYGPAPRCCRLSSHCGCSSRFGIFFGKISASIIVWVIKWDMWLEFGHGIFQTPRISITTGRREDQISNTPGGRVAGDPMVYVLGVFVGNFIGRAALPAWRNGRCRAFRPCGRFTLAVKQVTDFLLAEPHGAISRQPRRRGSTTFQGNLVDRSCDGAAMGFHP